MALVEVVNDKSAFVEHSWGYVVSNEKVLTTRYFLVFNGNYSYDASQIKMPKIFQ
jgi:hypothetical protein